jgi:hypothetical protein
MPRVPVIQESVESAPVRVPYQSAGAATEAAFGGLQARGLQQAGQQIAGLGDDAAAIALKDQAEDNERETKNKETEYRAQLRELTADYFDSKSNNTVNTREAVEAAVRKARQNFLDGTENARVKEMFGRVAAVHEEAYLGKIDGHYRDQRNVANDEASTARIGQSIDEVAAFPTDPTVIMRARATIEAEVRSRAERNGWELDVADAKREEELTAMHSTAIGALLESDPMAARAYYLKHKGEIDGTARPGIEKSLEAGELRQQSQQAADDIMARGLDERAALAEARKIKDPKLRDEVVQRVTSRYAENERIRNREDRQRTDSVWSHVLGGGSIDDLPVSTIAAMDGTTVSAMQAFERRRASEGRGFADASDPAAYNEIHWLYMDDKVGFAELDLSKYIGKLNESDYQYWLGVQRSVDRKAESEQAKAASYTLADRVAKEYMNAAGIDYGSTAGKKDAARAQKVLSMIRQTVDNFHAEGKKPTRVDIEQRLNEMFIVGDLSETGFGDLFSTDRYAFEVAGTVDEGRFSLVDVDKHKVRIADATGVPQQYVSDIAAILKSRDLPVTVDNIKALYDEWLKDTNAK